MRRKPQNKHTAFIHSIKKNAFLGLFGFAALIFSCLMCALPGMLLYKIFYAPRRDDLEVCPLPKGSYHNSCANISSTVLDDTRVQCKFTATCAQDSLKELLESGTCSEVPLLENTLLLPSFTTLYGLQNSEGLITSQLSRDTRYGQPYTLFVSPTDLDLSSIETRSTKQVPDNNCEIRKQFSAADLPESALAATAVVLAATLKVSL